MATGLRRVLRSALGSFGRPRAMVGGWKRATSEKGPGFAKTYLGEGSLGENTAKAISDEAAATDTGRRMAMASVAGGPGGATHISKQVLPQAPSPTMTSFRRISAMVRVLVACRLMRVAGSRGEGGVNRGVLEMHELRW